MLNIEFHSTTHKGKVRRINEDYLEFSEHGQYAVVADGIGGLNHGEVASTTAVKSSVKYLDEVLDNTSKEITKELANSIKIANEHLITIQKNDSRYAKMGTTLLSFAIKEGTLFYSWVGDSRLYLYKAASDELVLLTKDHTLDPSKFDDSAPAEMRRKASSVLTQMVGSILLLKPDVGSCSLEPDDLILGCTDGLSDYVQHEFMHEQIKSVNTEKSLEECCDKLLDKALDVGGRDNISFIAAIVREA